MVIDIQTKTRIDKMLQMCGNTKGKIVLDIGIGKNPISKDIEAEKIITIDAVPERQPTILHDLNDGIPIANESVDAIFAGEILEHMIYPKQFAEECFRVLKDQGVLLLSCPNLCNFKDRVKILFGSYPYEIEEDKWETHRSVWTLKKLKYLLKLVGFKIEQISTNGIISHSIRLFPLFLTPKTFGDSLIIKVRK